MVTNREIIDFSLFNITNIIKLEARNNSKMEISESSQNAAMVYYRQAHNGIVASQLNTNPDKKSTIKKSYYISTLIQCNVTTVVI